MSDKTSFNRRKFLESSAGVAAAASLGTGGALFVAAGAAQTLNLKPEKGAKLRVLRWSRFVQGDIDAYMANVKSFTEKTGIPVRVDNEGWEDVRPKAAVAANTGAGPDIILSTNDDANLYPDKLLDVTDVAEYIGKKYGGWYPAGQAFLQAGRQEVDRPPARRRRRDDRLPREHGEGGRLRHVPEGHRRLPEAVKALKEKGTPGGMALGNATGDGLWCNWLVWAFGGKLVDQNNKVVIDSPGDAEGARVRQGALRHLHPGHAVLARPEQQQGLPRRPDLAHQQRHLDLLRGEELARTRRSRRWRPTSSTRRTRSGRSACRPSRTCSSTR